MNEEYKRRYLRNNFFSFSSSHLVDVSAHKSFNFYRLIRSVTWGFSPLFIAASSFSLSFKVSFLFFMEESFFLRNRKKFEGFLMAIMRSVFMVVMLFRFVFNRHIFVMTSNCIRSLYDKRNVLKVSIERSWRYVIPALCVFANIFMTCLGNLLYTLKANLPYAAYKSMEGFKAFDIFCVPSSSSPLPPLVTACDCLAVIKISKWKKSFSLVDKRRTRKKSLPTENIIARKL